MADETHSEVSHAKASFISPSDDENSSNENSPSIQHIEEIQQQKTSSDDHLHIEPIHNGDHQHTQNGDHIQHSTDDHTDHTTENQTHFIQETTPTPTDDQESTSTSHIQPVDESVDQQDSSENSFQQSGSSNDQDQTDSSNNQDQSSFNDTNDRSNLMQNQDDYKTPNIDTSFPTQMDPLDQPEPLMAQREMDDNEIPPAEVPVDETPITNDINNSTTESETEITDTRLLTALETPYEHHDEDETQPTESSVDQTSINNESNYSSIETDTSLNEGQVLNERGDKVEKNTLLLSSFFPDVVIETIEQNHGDSTSESTQVEKPSVEENLIKEEDFPPLPLAQDPIHLIRNEKDYPPLPTPSNLTEQILHTESNHINNQPLLSTNEPVLPEPEDILGNKTLLKQILVKGTPDTNPTRSTLVTVSYTLSLVENLIANTRLIEKVSNERFFVSEHDIIPAIDISVQKMNRGERALIYADNRLCYGDIGCQEKQIPPVSTLNPYKIQIELELHDWNSAVDVQTLSIDDRLDWGDKKRKMGNFYFRRQDYPLSLQCYHGALRFLDTDNNPVLASCDQNQLSILNDRYIQVQNNVAQVNLQLEKYDACLVAVENVLKHDPKNVKALFRQGKALFKLGKYDQAIQPLKSLAQIQKGNSTTDPEKDHVNEMISVCENKLATYQKNEKEIYRRMFQPQPTTTTTQNQQRQTKNTTQTGNTNTNLWPYVLLGGAALAAVGVFTFMKYRKSA